MSSSQGNDAFDGLSEATPKRTIAAGYALLRDGYPDWLLLKSGDVWVGESLHWNKSGRSEAEKMVIGSYGSGPRPQIRTPGSGFVGIASVPRGHLAITDLHLVPQSYDGTGPYPPYGINLLDLWSDVLIENCKIERYFVNVCAQRSAHGRLSRLSIRRCVVVDAFRVGSEHAQGLFLGDIDGLLLEENVIDHNGWREDVAGADPNMFRHNVYMYASCTDAVTRGNIIARASNIGLSQRPGGICENNLLICNPIGLGFSSGDPGAAVKAIRNNVVLGARDINASNPMGFGIVVSGVDGVQVTGNVVAHNRESTGNVIGIRLEGVNQNTTVSGNTIYRWRGVGTGFSVAPAIQVGAAGSGVAIRDNDLQQPDGGYMYEFVPQSASGFLFRGNRYYTSNPPPHQFYAGTTYSRWVSFSGEVDSVHQAVSYPDPERTIETYMQHIGGSASVEAFLERTRDQRRGHWHAVYTASTVNTYIRAGFARTTGTVNP